MLDQVSTDSRPRGCHENDLVPVLCESVAERTEDPLSPAVADGGNRDDRIGDDEDPHRRSPIRIVARGETTTAAVS